MKDTEQKPEVNPSRVIGQASAETAALIKFLQTAEVGKVITYQEMRNVCKADVQEHPTHLSSARRCLLKQKMAFGTVFGIGIRRLADGEMPDAARDKQERARRSARNGLQILDCANMKNLDAESKIKAITTRTVLGFMSMAGSRKVLNLAEQSARTSNGEMKVGNLLDLFGK